MRLLSLELSGFRGFPKQLSFDLDADAIVVVGANGNGKTSLFDGILWALSGKIPRLQNDDKRLVSIYSDSGQARAVLRLEDSVKGKRLTVIRSFDGEERRVSLETSEGKYHGPSAEGRLIDLIWPDAASASDPCEALSQLLTCSVYLQQDVIRHFIEAASDQERFAAVSELVGIGRVTELQSSLERSKKAWSTATNLRQDELSPLQAQLAMIEARLSELEARASQVSPAIAAEAWDHWWQNLSGLGLTAVQVKPDSREAPAAIDYVIKQLDALRRSTERRIEALRSVQADIAGIVSQAIPEIQPLRDHLTMLREQIEKIKNLVAEEQTRLAELRRVQATLEEKNEQLRALASIAIKHLDNGCPVCAQAIDKEATRNRLEAIIKSGSRDEKRVFEPEKLPELLATLSEKEKETATAELALRSAEQMAKELKIAQETINKRLSDLNLATGDDVNQRVVVAEAIENADVLIRRYSELQSAGESMAMSLSLSSEAASIDELRREAEALRRKIIEQKEVISARTQTGDIAQSVIEGLRVAASTVVEERISKIGPLLQSIFARIDPHPAFRVVTFLSKIVRGKGQLSTIVSDPIEQKVCDLPASVLSSSQVNALAVSVFLALNIGVPTPPLSVAMLDDPLQSLDDINLLGLVDLLRRIKDRRQLVISTHDGRFGRLLSRKLRPRNENGRTIIIQLESWSRQGPVVEMNEVRSDPVPLRLVGSRKG